MKGDVRFQVVKNRFGRIPDDVRDQASRAVRRTLAAIEARAKVNIVVKGAVDTGALLDSVGPFQMTSELSGETGPSVEYAGFVEYGTWKMAARPCVGPAAEAERDQFAADIADAIRKAV